MSRYSILCTQNTEDFLREFLQGVEAGNSLFLCNPNWGKREWQQVEHLIKLPPLEFPAIMIPTGGTSGKLRFAIHTWDTLTASVRGLQSYLAVDEINSFCILPIYHVSGLMQFVRSFITGGKWVNYHYNVVKERDIKYIENEDFFLSLVPTQLQDLLDLYPEWLKSFKTIFLGGAPANISLLNKARNAHLPLSLTYGMTETASQIVNLKVEDFLQGMNNCGRVLPHAKLQIKNEQGHILGVNEVGLVCIEAASLYRGYYPDVGIADNWMSDDVGFLDSSGYLYLVGRNSQKIITGGENVFPSEIEEVIWQTGLVRDVVVIGLPQERWGEIVTAVYVGDTQGEDIKCAITPFLSKYKLPKLWISVQSIPRTPQGKINYHQIYQLLPNIRY